MYHCGTYNQYIFLFEKVVVRCKTPDCMYWEMCQPPPIPMKLGGDGGGVSSFCTAERTSQIAHELKENGALKV